MAARRSAVAELMSRAPRSEWGGWRGEGKGVAARKLLAVENYRDSALSTTDSLPLKVVS